MGQRTPTVSVAASAKYAKNITLHIYTHIPSTLWELCHRINTQTGDTLLLFALAFWCLISVDICKLDSTENGISSFKAPYNKNTQQATFLFLCNKKLDCVHIFSPAAQTSMHTHKLARKNIYIVIIYTIIMKQNYTLWSYRPPLLDPTDLQYIHIFSMHVWKLTTWSWVNFQVNCPWHCLIFNMKR